MAKFVFVFWFYLVMFSVSAQQKASDIFESGKNKVEFVSEAPLELIKASSTELKGLIRESDRTFAFSIPNSSFKGFNSPLQQEHFYENYIEADKYPTSSFEGKIIEAINFNQNGEYTVRAKGILDIHGIRQERVIRVSLRIENGQIQASAQFDVILEDHKITIPKMVYQKLSETITVSVNIGFSRQAD